MSPPSRSRSTPRLYVLTPLGTDPATLPDKLVQVLQAADVAAVLLRLPDAADERSLINLVKAVAPGVQNAGAALLVEGHPDIVARAGADGAHLAGPEALQGAVSRLKPDRIAGVGRLHSRHDAMLAAEAGADYVMFGEPDGDRRPSHEALLERVAWWAELFEIPCVAYAGELGDIEPLVAAGADFVAMGDALFNDPRGVRASAVAVAARLAGSEPAT
jgi:thiamine-phosphate pyrophosphorylase